MKVLGAGPGTMRRTALVNTRRRFSRVRPSDMSLVGCRPEASLRGETVCSSQWPVIRPQERRVGVRKRQVKGWAERVREGSSSAIVEDGLCGRHTRSKDWLRNECDLVWGYTQSKLQ